MNRNVFTSPLVIKKTEINYELFFKTLGGKCCIKDEIRRKFWGLDIPDPKVKSKNFDPHAPAEPESICSVFNEE